mgnify:CR=1 FL=1
MSKTGDFIFKGVPIGRDPSYLERFYKNIKAKHESKPLEMPLDEEKKKKLQEKWAKYAEQLNSERETAASYTTGGVSNGYNVQSTDGRATTAGNNWNVYSPQVFDPNQGNALSLSEGTGITLSGMQWKPPQGWQPGKDAYKNYEVIGPLLTEVAKGVGVPEELMIATAAQESAFNPAAKAGTSSAGGLFQFIDDTWASMVKKYGGKYGITMSTSKFDPVANAIMGAHFLKDNIEEINKKKKELGMPGATATDAYAAHFLGTGGAKKLLQALHDNPEQPISNGVVNQSQINANKELTHGGNITVRGFYNTIGQKSMNAIAKKILAQRGFPVNPDQPTQTTDGAGLGQATVTANNQTGAVVNNVPGMNGATTIANMVSSQVLTQNGNPPQMPVQVSTNNAANPIPPPAVNNNDIGGVRYNPSTASKTAQVSAADVASAIGDGQSSPAPQVVQGSASAQPLNQQAATPEQLAQVSGPIPMKHNVTAKPIVSKLLAQCTPELESIGKMYARPNGNVDLQGMEEPWMKLFYNSIGDYVKSTGDRSIFTITSGYRSPEKQRALYEENLRKYPPNGNGKVARPGRSRHEFGVALDITNSGSDGSGKDFTNGIVSRWENSKIADKWGFWRRLRPGVNKTVEDWHVENKHFLVNGQSASGQTTGDGDIMNPAHNDGAVGQNPMATDGGGGGINLGTGASNAVGAGATTSIAPELQLAREATAAASSTVGGSTVSSGLAAMGDSGTASGTGGLSGVLASNANGGASPTPAANTAGMMDTSALAPIPSPPPAAPANPSADIASSIKQALVDSTSTLMSKSEELLKQQVDLHIAGNKSLESIISLLQSKNEGSSSDTPLPVKDEKSEMKATSDKVKRHESITMGPIKTGR